MIPDRSRLDFKQSFLNRDQQSFARPGYR